MNQSGETLGADSPLCPQQRRESRHSRAAASGQQETHALQQFNRLLDDLIGAGEQRW
jgi:hypothetical protein